MTTLFLCCHENLIEIPKKDTVAARPAHSPSDFFKELDDVPEEDVNMSTQTERFFFSLCVGVEDGISGVAVASSCSALFWP